MAVQELIMNLLKGRWLIVNFIVIDLLVTAIGVGLAISGFEFLTKRGAILSPATGIPMWVFQSATLIGGVLLAVSGMVMIFRRTIQHDVDGGLV